VIGTVGSGLVGGLGEGALVRLAPVVIPRASRAARIVLRTALAGLAALAVLAPGAAAHADPSAAQIEAQITEASTKLEHTVEQFNKVTEELAASQAAAATLAEALPPLSAELDAATERVNALAVRAYQGAALAQVGALFSAGDPASVVDRLVTMDQMSSVERARIASYTDTKARVDAESARANQLIADQTAQRQTLDGQKKEIEANLARLYDLRRAAYGSAQTTGAAYTGPVPTVSGAAGIAVRFAYAAIGTPYVWAGSGPNGYDCSGLTQAAWRAAGRALPHNAAMQWNALPHISRAALSPGDLVFYSGLGHVGIYVGSGQIIHAPSFGDHVRLASVDVMPPYGYARP
jgi:peptidoglycan DL-endopeptidase CwlO